MAHPAHLLEPSHLLGTYKSTFCCSIFKVSKPAYPMKIILTFKAFTNLSASLKEKMELNEETMNTLINVSDFSRHYSIFSYYNFYKVKFV
jgi:hypothetical protein